MADRITNPFAKLFGLRHKAHPWHGIDIGDNAPEVIKCFIEIVPSDTVKYEVDKDSGYLKIDRPQKFSNFVPALYGFIPQSYCADNIAQRCREVTGRDDIIGDKDPLDILVLTEKVISHGDLLVWARPIGGLRMIDGREADDKIIAVLRDDAVYNEWEDITDVPELVIKRLKHYFLTYKDMPGEENKCEITEIYGRLEAHDTINRAMKDYKNYVESLLFE